MKQVHLGAARGMVPAGGPEARSGEWARCGAGAGGRRSPRPDATSAADHRPGVPSPLGGEHRQMRLQGILRSGRQRF